MAGLSVHRWGKVHQRVLALMMRVLQAEPIRVVVTGAAGQIAYSLLYSIAKGDVFGKEQVGSRARSAAGPRQR